MSNYKFRQDPNKRNGIIFEQLYEFNPYLESDNHSAAEVIKLLKSDLWTKNQIAYILHDKDVDDNGLLKKPHYHILVKFSDRRQINAISKKYKCPENLIRWKCDFKGSVRYLVHADDPDKFQYSWDDVTANFDLSDYSEDNNLDEVGGLNLIIDFYRRNNPNLYQLFKYASKNGLYSQYRRNYHILWDMFSDQKDSLKGDSYFTEIV